MRVDVRTDRDVNARTRPIERLRAMHPVRVITTIRTEEEKGVTAPQLSVNDFARLLSHEILLEPQRSAKPIDRRPRIAVTQNRDQQIRTGLIQRKLAPRSGERANARDHRSVENQLTRRVMTLRSCPELRLMPGRSREFAREQRSNGGHGSCATSRFGESISVCGKEHSFDGCSRT